MRHPLENNPLFQELMKPDWTDIVWAICKLSFYTLIVFAFIKYIFF